MTDNQQRLLETLREIDISLHRLFEAVDEADKIAADPASDPLETCRRIRSQLDAALFGHQHRTDDAILPAAGSCVLQWGSPGSLPRRLEFKPDDSGDSWQLSELEWTGADWRVCRVDEITHLAIAAPADPRYPDPVDPPTLQTLIDWITDSLTRPDPPVLAFESDDGIQQGVVAAVDDELRYRQRDARRWYETTTDELYHHLEQQGQPTLESLSETPLDRRHFTASPLNHDN